MTTVDDAIDTWGTLWQQGRRVFKRHAAGGAREGLELLLAALLYQRWALAGLEPRVFHLTTRDNPPLTMAQLVAGAADPLTDRHHVGATMHLASASIRFPVAIQQIIRTVQRAPEFDGLYSQGQEPWPRARACRYLDEVRRLGHCSSGLTLPLAVVVLLLVRDEFGHGEEGSGEGHWFRDREATLTGVHRCRLVEAQQMLARWAFDRLDGP
jgi:hypothetical protein